MDAKDYWRERSKTYSSLDDVKSKRTAYKIVQVIKKFGLKRDARILDVGCAEGTITKVIRENFRHSHVKGIDLSEEMITKARQSILPGLSFEVSNLFRHDCLRCYDLITSTLVLHHLTLRKDRAALLQFYDSLKVNGYVLIAEAIPPVEEIFDHYKEIFTVKEERNCYTLGDLVDMVRGAGFVGVRSTSYRFDLRLSNWLNDPTLSKEKKQLLHCLHTEASLKFKKAYNMTPLQGGDYILSCRMAIVFGRK